MALDTSIIRQATFQPVQFQMPSQANMLANAAQAVSGLQTLESNRMRMRQAQQEEAATSQMMQGIKRAYAMGETPESIQAYEEALIGSGQPQYVNAGMKLRMARMEDAKQRQAQAQMRQEYEQWASGGGQAAPAAAPVDNTLALGVETPATPPSQNMLTQGPADPYAARRQQLLRASQHPNPQIAAAAKLELSQMPRMAMPGQWKSAGGRGELIFHETTGEHRALPVTAPPAREAATKPVAPMRVRPGETVVSSKGEVLFTAPAAPARAGGTAPAAAGTKPTATQAAKAETQAQAREDLSTELRTVLNYYQQLNDLGAMTDPTRSPLDNVIAFARSSGVGQEAERAAGTKAQTLRDNIANARQRILSHVKNVTGATSKQMDSNRELQIWLDSLTTPQQSMSTVRETLKQLDRVMGSVRGQVEREAQGGAGRAPAAAPAAAPAPAAGNRREIAPGVFVTERP